MPIYEYECTACNERFERKQRIGDDPVKVCPTCGGATRKVLHPVGIIFKGSGWYITDSRSSSNGKSAAGEASGESKPADSKPEAKSESKAETKAEAKPASKS